MDKYQETIQTWNKLANLYEELFMDLELYEDTYVAFCQAINKEDACILEIGCGPGNITKRLLHHHPNFQITATDVAPTMVSRAQKNNPKATCIVLDARNLGQLSGRFEGIVAGFTLPYLSSVEVSKLIANCQKLLQKKGILYLSFVLGAAEQSGYISGSTGDRTYFYYHELAFIKDCLHNNKLKASSIVIKHYQKSEDNTEQHCIILSQKQTF